MKARCGKCSQVFEAEPDEANVLQCTECGAKMRVRPKGDSAQGKTADTPSRSRTEASETPSKMRAPKAAGETPSAGKLPAIMRANKVVAGRSCPICEARIELGTEVHNCEKCGSSHHSACWDDKGGCASDDCAAEVAKEPVRRGVRARRDDDEAEEEGGDTKPCRYCGETIKANARKCRFCNEFQNLRDREAQQKAQTGGGGADDDVTAIDWVVGLLCPIIGCILGIVRMIQGKKSGPKIIGISFIGMVLGAIVRMVLEPRGRYGGGY